MDRDIRATFMETSVATWLLMDEVHGSKNALLVFMDLSDTNYKFMNSKIHFQSLWIYVFKVYGSQ